MAFLKRELVKQIFINVFFSLTHLCINMFFFFHREHVAHPLSG